MEKYRNTLAKETWAELELRVCFINDLLWKWTFVFLDEVQWKRRVPAFVSLAFLKPQGMLS